MSQTAEVAIAATTHQAFTEAFDGEKERELFWKEYELSDGREAIDMGSLRHSGVGTRLIIRMGSHVEANRLGAVYGPDATFLIGGKERLPDISFLSGSRFPEEGETLDKCQVAPDLAVEVISPNEIWEKVNSKVLAYFAAGVRQVWLISLEHGQVYVYESPSLIRILTEKDELANDELLPGFRCRISELFQQPVFA
jgi:Uma2 family endonuclease